MQFNPKRQYSYDQTLEMLIRGIQKLHYITLHFITFHYIKVEEPQPCRVAARLASQRAYSRGLDRFIPRLNTCIVLNSRQWTGLVVKMLILTSHVPDVNSLAAVFPAWIRLERSSILQCDWHGCGNGGQC